MPKKAPKPPPPILCHLTHLSLSLPPLLSTSALEKQLFVLAYFFTHPFSWKWTTRGGPNKGKSFPVPTIPTACTQVDHRAVRWTVDLFHSFKAHLSDSALFEGRVRPDIIKLYQNNMLIHYWSQLKALRLSSAVGVPPSHTTPCPPTQLGTVTASSPPPDAITALLQRITALESELSQVKQLLQQGGPSAHPPPFLPT
ncbi:hypothetical protein JVT61DRAFT_7903 [Boletus reticuloceps]|uniref:Uncharacterized protein n=1 Tax=Boletus reticuloceps TaxID=495285 RepID=A0A8I2YHB0_9AGAM|nr:hypothetical protein JVT61DRAFT_7903 [Boletus reticuloceps]